MPWKTLVLCALSTILVAGAPAPSGAEVRPVRDRAADADSPRPSDWAQPIAQKGLPNLHRVTGKLYRGAQPTATGFKALKELGIRTVVNLRKFHTDKGLLKGLKMGYEEIPAPAWSVTEEDVIRFLTIATDPKRQPVFVHCQHGADRTGTMIAAWRMVVQGWTVDQALREMTEGGFGYHEMWENLPDLLRALDVAKIREAVGLPPR